MTSGLHVFKDCSGDRMANETNKLVTGYQVAIDEQF